MPATWLQPINEVFANKQWPPLSDAEAGALERSMATLAAGDAGEFTAFWRNLYAQRTRSNPLHMRDPWETVAAAIDVCREASRLDDAAAKARFEAFHAAMLEERLAQQAHQIQYLQQLNFHLEYEFEQRHGKLAYFQDLHDQARAELYALHELSMYVNSSLEEETVLGCTIDGLVGLLDLSYCGIFRLTGDDELEVAARHGLDVPERYRPPLKGWLAKAAMSPTVVRVDQILERGEETADLRELAAAVESLALFPLVNADNVIGVLVLGHQGHTSVPVATVDFVNVLAPHIAAAMHNAEQHQRINQMAITDGLTGLYNHRYFHERLQHNIEVSRRYMRPFSLLMIDIDHFKTFNDTYGHQAGDRVLRFVAKKLRGLLRNTDILARYGGEEFGVQLLETPHDRAWLAAERLVKSFEEDPIELPTTHGPVAITVSIGVATYPHDGETATDLIKFADEGLYVAKRAGRNQVGFAENRLFE